MSDPTVIVKVPHGSSEGHLEAPRGTRLEGVNYSGGAKAVGLIRVAADVADTETVTIGSDVYEFDRAANGVTAGRIAVVGHADDTPANATNALISTINARGSEPITAIDHDANTIILVADAVGVVTDALAEALAGANNTIDPAMAGGAAAGSLRAVITKRVPTTVEVALGLLVVACPFTPRLVQIQVQTTSTGALVAWDGGWTLDTTDNLVKINNGGSVDWATTSTLNIVVWE